MAEQRESKAWKSAKQEILRTPIHTKPFTTATYEPMERINIDTIGPLPMDKYGYCHIIVIINCFTRFIELYPAHSTSAGEAIKALMDHVGRYGPHLQILSGTWCALP